MERGGVNCIGTTWAAVKATMRPILEYRAKVNVLVQWHGHAKCPPMPGVRCR